MSRLNDKQIALGAATRSIELKEKNVLRREQQHITNIAKQERKQKIELNKLQQKQTLDLQALQNRHKQTMTTKARVHQQNLDSFKTNNLKQFQKISDETAKQIADLNSRSLKQLNDFKVANTQKIADMISTSQDIFYKQNTFNSQLGADDKNYTITVNLPPHEARNLLVSGRENEVKLSLARRFESANTLSPNKTNTTKKFETITDTHKLAGQVDFRKIEKDYSNGVLTIKLPKIV